MQEAPLRPSSALVAYAEPLIAGRRVLVIGDATSELAEQLLDRGARLIHIYDPDPARVSDAATRNTERRVSLAPLGDGHPTVREGSFDCAIIEDLASIPQPQATLRTLRRALSSTGTALIASPNPDVERRLLKSTEHASGQGHASEHGHASEPATPLDYYGLYDLVSAELSSVRMLGQTPFVGYAIVDFQSSSDPEPTFDAGFVPGGAEEPEQYIAVGSMAPQRLDELAIVQLPLARVREGSRGSRSDVDADARAKQVSRLESELRRLRQRDTGELDRLREELDRRDSWIRELEDRAAAADQRADDAEAELETARERNEALNQARDDGSKTDRELTALRERLDEVGRVAARTQKERDWAEERARTLEKELESALQAASDAPSGAAFEEQTTADLDVALGEVERLEAETKRLTRSVQEASERAQRAEARASRLKEELAQVDVGGEAAEDLTQLEKQLEERGAKVAELESQIRRLERYGKELIQELTALREGTAAADETADFVTRQAELEAQLNHLAQVNASREADLVAADWALAELRDKLADGVPAQVAIHPAS